ncbi:hypothetical protein, partial [Glaesserella parasuis]|uniref:hypothetical protein n=1 Tax=Glaesserella parasuis TaxID=738 RepID=UPI00271FDC01|nr:hypothetical protein [Glaesserella parasuis]
FGFADEVIHAYATERVLALGTPKLWITLWFMLLVYYNFNIQGIGQSEAEHYLVLEWTPEGKTQPVKEALSLGDLGEREGWRQL